MCTTTLQISRRRPRSRRRLCYIKRPEGFCLNLGNSTVTGSEPRVSYNILCAYDESPPADRAFEFALQLATYFRGELHVLFVYQPLGDETRLRPEVVRKSAEDTFAPAFARLQKRAQAAGCPLSCVTAMGQPWQMVLVYAQQIQADHIVVAHRGSIGLPQATIDSVSRKVLKNAAVPVTVVP